MSWVVVVLSGTFVTTVYGPFSTKEVAEAVAYGWQVGRDANQTRAQAMLLVMP